MEVRVMGPTTEHETPNLLRQADTLSALSHIAVHLVLALGMVWLGHALAKAAGV
jgi:fluoride ion exporter CrcB/FEX